MCSGGFESQIVRNGKIIVCYPPISISLACLSNCTEDFVMFKRQIMVVQLMTTVIFILALRCGIFSWEIDLDNDIAIQMHAVTVAILTLWIREGYIETMTLLYRLSADSPFLFTVFFFWRQNAESRRARSHHSLLCPLQQICKTDSCSGEIEKAEILVLILCACSAKGLAKNCCSSGYLDQDPWCSLKAILGRNQENSDLRSQWTGRRRVHTVDRPNARRTRFEAIC
jgi:hypothetical protein